MCVLSTRSETVTSVASLWSQTFDSASCAIRYSVMRCVSVRSSSEPSMTTVGWIALFAVKVHTAPRSASSNGRDTSTGDSSDEQNSRRSVSMLAR